MTPVRDVTKYAFLVLFLLIVGAPLGSAQRSSCSVEEYKDYYGKDLEEDYGLRRVAERVAQALYEGPLMREGDPAGIGHLRMLFTREREMTIRRLQEIVKDHLYGESPEFRDLYRDLSQEQGRMEASHTIVDSIYRAFGYRSARPSEETFDACLIRNREAHLVVTKALIRMRGVRD